MQYTAHLKENTRQLGFTLIEIALVIMMSGFVMLMAAQFIKLYTINAERQRTIDHLEITQDALHEYFGLNRTYPCPADPTLQPGDANYGLAQCRSAANLTANRDDCTGAPANITCTTDFSRDGDENGAPDVVMIGAIPFRTLHLSLVTTAYNENHRLDGYSTLISYAVTEHMADTSRYSLVNPVNPRTGAIRIIDENNINLTIPPDSAHYVMFSHGDNKKGGYTSAGNMVDNCMITTITAGVTNTALPAPGPSGAGIDLEIENCDNNDAIFEQGIRSLGDNSNYNDDVLYYQSTGIVPLWKRTLGNFGGQSHIYNTNLGRVGVGTVTPQKKLHIVGDLSAEQSIIATDYCDGISTDCIPPGAIAGTGSDCNDPNDRSVAYAIQNNAIVCREVEWAMPAQTCPAGEYIQAISNLGTIICTAY